MSTSPTASFSAVPEGVRAVRPIHRLCAAKFCNIIRTILFFFFTFLSYGQKCSNTAENKFALLFRLSWEQNNKHSIKVYKAFCLYTTAHLGFICSPNLCRNYIIYSILSQCHLSSLNFMRLFLDYLN